MNGETIKSRAWSNLHHQEQYPSRSSYRKDRLSQQGEGFSREPDGIGVRQKNIMCENPSGKDIKKDSVK